MKAAGGGTLGPQCAISNTSTSVQATSSARARGMQLGLPPPTIPTAPTTTKDVEINLSPPAHSGLRGRRTEGHVHTADSFSVPGVVPCRRAKPKLFLARCLAHLSSSFVLC